ncbi:DNA damage-binding protein 1, partial [Cymbomonas tetramitiformis]
MFSGGMVGLPAPGQRPEEPLQRDGRPAGAGAATGAPPEFPPTFVLGGAAARKCEKTGSQAWMFEGTQPIVLHTFRSQGSRHVFAASDRPTVIYSSNRKLLYSNVNLREVSHVAPFNSSSFPDSLAISMDSNLTIGTIDNIQKLHIRTVPLGEPPRRIAHQESSHTFAVGTQRVGQAEDEGMALRLLDNQTFDTLHRFQLGQHEMLCSLVSCTFAEDPVEYFVVGSAYALPEESEPSRGRILVLAVEEGSKLTLIAEKEVKGAVYNLNAFNGKLLAGVNAKMHLFKWGMREGQHELTQECTHSGSILALQAVTRGDFIVVGDLMKSISLLMYKPEEGIIEERARDYNGAWISAVDVLDDDTYIGAENSFNLFTLRKNSDAQTEEERNKLEVLRELQGNRNAVIPEEKAVNIPANRSRSD